MNYYHISLYIISLKLQFKRNIFTIIIFFFLSTFCMIDESETCFAVNVYNMVQGKGVIIGDSVCIVQPFVQHLDFNYKDKVSLCLMSFQFKFINFGNLILFIFFLVISNLLLFCRVKPFNNEYFSFF